MPIFMRFDDNNQRVETTVLTKKPEGDAWYKAPVDFDWAKTYVLDNGKVIEQISAQPTTTENQEAPTA